MSISESGDVHPRESLLLITERKFQISDLLHLTAGNSNNAKAAMHISYVVTEMSLNFN